MIMGALPLSCASWNEGKPKLKSIKLQLRSEKYTHMNLHVKHKMQGTLKVGSNVL
jgi:hypothetical protein